MKSLYIIFMLVFTFSASIAQTGNIEGKVIDKQTNEGVPFANIIIEGTTIGAVSDIEGDFKITGISPGYVIIKTSFVGYQTHFSDEIFVTNSNTPFIEIFLEEEKLEIDEVIISVSVFEKDKVSPISAKKISISEIETNPGSNRDISKVIQSYPGVGFVASFRNDILIRGGGPAENVYYLDDVEIPNINHFSTQGASGGAVGIINADLLQSVDFLSGGFPANRSNTLSSVFELKQKQGNKIKPKYRVGIGASETAFSSDGPLGKKSNYLFSVRQSYLQFLFDALGLPFLPTFSDYQLKLEKKIDEKNEIKLISIGALDQFRLNTGLEEPTEDQEYILSYLPVNEQWSYTIGTVYKHFGDDNVSTVVLSRNMLNNSSYKYPENDETKQKVQDYLSQEIENKIRIENTRYYDAFRLNFGFNAEYAKYNNKTANKLFLNNQLVDVTYDTDIKLFKYGFFTQMNGNLFSKRLLYSGGFRVDANNFDESMSNPLNQLSPRISLSYKLLEKVSVNFNTGKYYRLPAYTSLGFKDNNDVFVNKENNISYIGVNHIIGGFDYDFSDHIVFNLEGFYKKYTNYPFSVKDSITLASKGADFGVVGDEEIMSTSEGRAYGLEFSNRIKFSQKVNFVFAYTYVISEFLDKNNEYKPTSWDSKHIISTTGTVNLKKNWSVGFKWRYSGGLPYTPYDLETSALKTAWATQGRAFFDYDLLNTERLEAFHQLDLRIDKQYFFDKWSLMMYFDVQNAYNFQSDQVDFVVREKKDNGEFATTDSDTKYILKPLSSTSGTVLPTIGIMMEF